MISPPPKETPIIPKSAIPTHKNENLPPLCPQAFDSNEPKLSLREQQLQNLLKENIELAEENEKLRYEIAYEAKIRDEIIKQNGELKNKGKEKYTPVRNSSDTASLTYSISQKGNNSPNGPENAITFRLTESPEKSIQNSLNKTPKKDTPVFNDTILPTEEEWLNSKLEKSPLKLPKAFIPKKAEYFMSGVLISAKTCKKNITEFDKKEECKNKSPPAEEYYKEMDMLLSQSQKICMEQGKETEGENSNVLLQTEDLSAITPLKENAVSPYIGRKQECKNNYWAPSKFIDT